MTRHLAAMLLALSAATQAPAQAPAAPWNESYAEKTQALSLKGDAARGAEAFVICQGCHRAGALGREDGSYPRLAGQHASVLIKQLADVRSGRRDNPKMLPFADHQALSVQEIADIAAYLQALPVPPTQGRGAGSDTELGRRLYATDCSSCHGAGGEGDAAKFHPRLSGQHYRYLLREVRLIRDGARRNANPEMVKVMGKYADTEIEAVTDYISRLPAAAR